MKRLGSGWFERPEAVLLDEGVCEHDELSHDGRQGKFFGLSGGEEALVEAFEMGIEARRRMGCHVDAGAHGLAAAAYAARTIALAAVAGERGEPREHAGLPGIEMPSSGMLAISPAPVTAPTPGMETRMSNRRARTASRSMV